MSNTGGGKLSELHIPPLTEKQASLVLNMANEILYGGAE